MQTIDRQGRIIVSREQRARIVFHLLAATVVQCLFFGAACAVHLVSGTRAITLVFLVAGRIGLLCAYLSQRPVSPIACWLLVAAWGCIFSFALGLAETMGFAGMVAWPAALFLVTKIVQHTNLAN
ncbi:hypothetical protein [Burkholderia sp. L27(2015)]|uniref:hypothetical protein n=1 Tax=Burkholderia sp. L27(2015) TaxID=1641858 RepID=UPI00131D590E|nr:hypothetical protein [Burkholderia sp. L27(2015)]